MAAVASSTWRSSPGLSRVSPVAPPATSAAAVVDQVVVGDHAHPVGPVMVDQDRSGRFVHALVARRRDSIQASVSWYIAARLPALAIGSLPGLAWRWPPIR